MHMELLVMLAVKRRLLLQMMPERSDGEGEEQLQGVAVAQHPSRMSFH